MRNQIRDAFDSIEASAELKKQTHDYLMKKKRRHFIFTRHISVPALCSFILIVLAAFGWSVYQTPVVAISIDINPSIELKVNCFDRVIGVEGFNEEGDLLAKKINLKNMSYERAVETLLGNEAIATYLSDERFVSITVACNNQDQSEAIRQKLQRNTADCQFEVFCMAGNSDDVEKAHEVGLSLGKYRAFEQLQALDSSITVEDVKDKTMRELHDWITELSNGQLDDQSNGNDTGPQDGSGHQYGKN